MTYSTEAFRLEQMTVDAVEFPPATRSTTVHIAYIPAPYINSTLSQRHTQSTLYSSTTVHTAYIPTSSLHQLYAVSTSDIQSTLYSSTTVHIAYIPAPYINSTLSQRHIQSTL